MLHQYLRMAEEGTAEEGTAGRNGRGPDRMVGSDMFHMCYFIDLGTAFHLAWAFMPLMVRLDRGAV